MERYDPPRGRLPEAEHTVSENEKQLILSMVDYNKRVAGDENPYQAFWHFKLRATPYDMHTQEDDPFRNMFEFQTPNGRIWHIQRILTDNQYVMRTNNQGLHVMVWGRNVLVKLPE